MSRLAWLIERNSMWGCEWFCAGDKDHRWTKDANKAIHFPLRVAAEEIWGWSALAKNQQPHTFPYEQEGVGDWTYKYEVTEHMFIDDPAEQNAAAKGEE